jgi:ABC-type tungstate transport system substrate-binding protein
MDKKKQRAVYIAVILVVISVTLSIVYRKYIYQNHIYDYHLADTIGNIFAVPAALFFLSGINSKETKIIYSIPAVVLGFIVFELMSLTGLHGTFDIFDIIATIISGLITYVILNFLSIKQL